MDLDLDCSLSERSNCKELALCSLICRDFATAKCDIFSCFDVKRSLERDVGLMAKSSKTLIFGKLSSREAEGLSISSICRAGSSVFG